MKNPIPHTSRKSARPLANVLKLLPGEGFWEARERFERAGGRGLLILH